MMGWYTDEQTHQCQENHIPDTLAPAQYIEVLRSFRIRASVTDWYKGKIYRLCLDADGVPYCADVGLAPWAKYVSTDLDGSVHQYCDTPKWCADDGLWDNTDYRWKAIPESSARLYRKDVAASESLMRVWRDE